MDQAIGIHKDTQQEHVFSIKEYKARFDRGEALADIYNLVSPTLLSPVQFINGYAKQGFYKSVSAHFRRVSGDGTESQEHFYDHSEQTKPDTLKSALNSGKKILLSLNLDLSYSRPRFDKPLESFIPPHRTRARWVSENYGNYISVSVRNVGDAIKTILKVAAYDQGKSIKNRVFANYRGGILPYNEFYLGRRTADLAKTYNDLVQGRAGAEYKEYHVVGMPRLLNFIPTQTTLDKPKTKAIRGNADYNTHQCHQLIFAQKDVKDTPEFTSLWHDIEKSMSDKQVEKRGLFVLACPVVKLSVKGESAPRGNLHNYTRWNISNIEDQITLPLLDR